MQKISIYHILISILLSFSDFAPTPENPDFILGTWTLTKVVCKANKSYEVTPKTFRTRKKLKFSQKGEVAIYKDDVLIRISKYAISKGISVFDQLKHELISFEGVTYVMENLDHQNLTLTKNSLDGYSSIFKK